jgi:hypothetical protein
MMMILHISWKKDTRKSLSRCGINCVRSKKAAQIQGDLWKGDSNIKVSKLVLGDSNIEFSKLVIGDSDNKINKLVLGDSDNKINKLVLGDSDDKVK